MKKIKRKAMNGHWLKDDFLKLLFEDISQESFFSLRTHLSNILKNNTDKGSIIIVNPKNKKKFELKIFNEITELELNDLSETIVELNLKKGGILEFDLKKIFKKYPYLKKKFSHLRIYNYLISYPILTTPFNYVIILQIYLLKKPSKNEREEILLSLSKYKPVFYFRVLEIMDYYIKNLLLKMMKSEIPLEFAINEFIKDIERMMNLESIKIRLTNHPKRFIFEKDEYEIEVKNNLIYSRFMINEHLWMEMNLYYSEILNQLLSNEKLILKDAFSKYKRNFEFLIELLKVYDNYIRIKSELIKKAFTDNLTNAYNRQALDKLKYDWNNFRNVVLFYFDIDNFKEINDKYGHEAGDIALIEFVKAIKKIIRPNDLLFRMGGDEFLLIMNDVPEEDYTQINNRIENIFPIKVRLGKNKRLEINASIGSTYVHDPSIISLESVIKKTDGLMYDVKKTKKRM